MWQEVVIIGVKKLPRTEWKVRREN